MQPSGPAVAKLRSSAGAFGVAEKQKLRASDYPLIARILQGPCEQVSKVFLMEKDQVEEVTYDVSLPARDARRFRMGWGRSRSWETLCCRNCFASLPPLPAKTPHHGEKPLVSCLKSSFKLYPWANAPGPVLPSQI